MAESSETAIDPFGQPCDLWVLPPPRASAWFPLIDWYLNWQMSKGLSYSGLYLPNEVLRLAEDYEVPLPPNKSLSAQAPLLVLSRGRLPTDKCVVLDFETTADNWLKQVHETALKLDAATVHVFLPSKLAKNEAGKIWNNQFKDRNARFSADTEAKG